MEYAVHLNEKCAQPLKDYLRGTAEPAARFAERFGKADWGYACGILHDYGSSSDVYSGAFSITCPAIGNHYSG